MEWQCQSYYVICTWILGNNACREHYSYIQWSMNISQRLCLTLMQYMCKCYGRIVFACICACVCVSITTHRWLTNREIRERFLTYKFPTPCKSCLWFGLASNPGLALLPVLLSLKSCNMQEYIASAMHRGFGTIVSASIVAWACPTLTTLILSHQKVRLDQAYDTR